MAVENKFSHITVTEDDEFVIHAGVHAAGNEPAVEAPVAAPVEAPVAEAPAEAFAEAAAEAPVSSAERSAESPSAAPFAESAADEPASPAVGRRAKEGYHETTAEDLKPQPMPLAQKVVIGAAILLVALIVFYLFMR